MSMHQDAKQPAQSEMQGATLPPCVVAAAKGLAQRQMGRAALLLLIAHQPAAFFAGQFLYLCAPVYRIFAGGSAHESVLEAWAETLAQPEAVDALRPLLLTDHFSP